MGKGTFGKDRDTAIQTYKMIKTVSDLVIYLIKT